MSQDIEYLIDGIDRRTFLYTGALALLAGAMTSCDRSGIQSGEQATPQTQSPQELSQISLTRSYTPEEQQRLYKSFDDIAAMATSGRNTDHMLFYWDPEAKLLVNPYNVKPSLKPAKYSFETDVLSYHVSTQDYENLWKDLKNDAQLHLSLSSPINDSDDWVWTLMSGIDVFLGGKDGVDQRLKKFVENTKITNKFARVIEKIEIPSGTGRLGLQIYGQKKKSLWRKIFSVVGGIANSPIFSTLPIPKLLPQALQFAEAVLDSIAGSNGDNNLVPIWRSGRILFRLYDGATGSNPFVLRPGYWVTVDRLFAAKNLDANQNLKNYFLNIPGQFWELCNSSGNPVSVDANYCVMEFQFPELKT